MKESNIFIIAFTKKGKELRNYIIDALNKSGCFSESAEWNESIFKKGNTIIFIGAVGIAVRYISKCIISKFSDPAVLVIDEKGNYIIPILSGHIGRANKMALMIADLINAQAVITTATDINNIFAVDSWAVDNNMSVIQSNNIKNISATLLNDERVGLVSDFKINGKLPKNVILGNDFENGICISMDIQKKPFNNTLNLVPACISIGLGCRKNISFEILESVFIEVLNINKIPLEAVKRISSIDIKKNESALLKLSEKYNIKFETFSADVLNSLKGDFDYSDFVFKTTGVGNVCERAALCGNEGKFIMKKKSKNGVTAAVFLINTEVNFYV